MLTRLRVIARTLVFRFPIILGTIRYVGKRLQFIREYKNIHSLLSELNSDISLQIPILVRQNRKLYKEVDLLRKEIVGLTEIVKTLSK